MSARMRPLRLTVSAFATVILVIFLTWNNGMKCHAKIFKRCELARQLAKPQFGLSLEEISNWVCIAEQSSGLDSAAYARGLASGSHGLFQISDLYWCSPPGKGFACNISCEQLRDDNLADDIACARNIYSEHQRISGNGYEAWNPVYENYCRYNVKSYTDDCFPKAQKHKQQQQQQYRSVTQHNQATSALTVYSNFINEYSSQKYGKVYNKCELAQELYFKHKMPMEQIPTWVCIAQHESNFDTAAVGRLNADGSSDHGLFQISDLYWCSKDHLSGGKACGLSCNKLLDHDITDDVHCIRRIHNEHIRLSGDGFEAWTVYNPHCRDQTYKLVSHCFNQKSSQHTKSYAQTHLHSTAHGNAHSYAQHTAQVQVQYHQQSSNPFLKQHAHANAHAQSKPLYTSTSTANATFSYHSSSSSGIAFAATHKHIPYKTHTQKGKVYNRCELAQELFFKHKFPIQEIASWVCIAEYESNFDTSVVGQLNGDGSADHGIFQISDLYWCTHDDFGGKGCGLPCHKLLDSDLTDDIKCIRTIYDEHKRIAGNGFTAWTVYNRNCHGHNRPLSISDCFDSRIVPINEQKNTSNTNQERKSQGKVYTECELAQELLMKHKLPLEQIATWVCIAQYESSFNTAAVGRLNADGSADHGLFQISDLFWCSHNDEKSKACKINCNKLLDSDITDDVQCIKTIHEEHTRISGDGFTAWTVYKPHCRHKKRDTISKCFNNTNIEQYIGKGISPSAPKRKLYKKCELAQELYFKHKIPMWQVPTWVCIAQHESSFDTSAVGRLNADGSADHGLFQISDLYWCSHDESNSNGKACNIPCRKLLDNDITDDVRCIKIIYDEHTRISGDGFNAWTVYKQHCHNQGLEKIKDCFESKLLQESEQEFMITKKPFNQHFKPMPNAPFGINSNRITDNNVRTLKPHAFKGNPFLNKLNPTSNTNTSIIPNIAIENSFIAPKIDIHQTGATDNVATLSNYITNPFLGKLMEKENKLHQIGSDRVSSDSKINNFKPDNNIVYPQKLFDDRRPIYSSNPFLSELWKRKENTAKSPILSNPFFSKVANLTHSFDDAGQIQPERLLLPPPNPLVSKSAIRFSANTFLNKANQGNHEEFHTPTKSTMPRIQNTVKTTTTTTESPNSIKSKVTTTPTTKPPKNSLQKYNSNTKATPATTTTVFEKNTKYSYYPMRATTTTKTTHQPFTFEQKNLKNSTKPAARPDILETTTKTILKYPQFNHSSNASTPSPSPKQKKWSYNWADYFSTTKAAATIKTTPKPKLITLTTTTIVAPKTNPPIATTTTNNSSEPSKATTRLYMKDTFMKTKSFTTAINPNTTKNYFNRLITTPMTKRPITTFTTKKILTTSKPTTTKNPTTLKNFFRTIRSTTTTKPTVTTTTTKTLFHYNNHRSKLPTINNNDSFIEEDINKAIATDDLEEKYRKDPFSHPFFAKFNEKFASLFAQRKNSSLHSS